MSSNVSERNSESLQLFLFHGTKFLTFFSSAEGFVTEFRGFSFYFCPTVQNSKHFSLPQNNLERNSEGLLLFFSTVQNSKHFPLPRNGSEWNSDSFLFRGTAGILPEQIKCSVHSVFRGIIFLTEISNPNPAFSKMFRP